MCNSTSTSRQWSAWPSVWPQTKEMWANIHFHMPLCLFCEIRLAFNRCYFSPVRFSLRPVWSELTVIACYWYRVASKSHCSSPPCWLPSDQTAWRIQTLFLHCKTCETARKHDVNTWNGPTRSLSDKGDSVKLCYMLTWLRLEQRASARLSQFLPSLILKHTQPN